MKKKTVLCGLAAILSASAALADVETPTVMTIVNFVRGCEPRYPDVDLVEPLREEIRLNTQHHLPNTILLQYDALLRPDMVAAAKAAEPGRTEYGVWLEMCRQLVEKAGLAWRGRPGWDWEWFVNPGLPMGYSPAEREKICDEVFRLFKETFGDYPKSVGGWLLDAPTMDYLARTYGVDAFCICREQDATDAYGLRGGYANGAFYPSKRNGLSAAVDMKNAIPTPVFRMLTPDPIYNYGAGWNERGQFKSPIPEACTLEPGCPTGQRKDIVDWFFRVYTGPARLGLSYMQTGQENGMGWGNISKGLPYQLDVLDDCVAKGKVEVMTLGEAGRRFKAKHRENVPQTLVALEDWSGQGYKSVWYSSKHYRMNLFFDGKTIRFRDIHKFSDDHREAYLTAATKSWFGAYVTPPVVDSYMLSDVCNDGSAVFGGTFASFDATAADDKTLVVTAGRADGTKLVVTFREDSIAIDFGLTSEEAFRTAALKFRGGGAFVDSLEFPPGKIVMTFEGVTYSVGYEGDLKPSRSGWTLNPIRGKAKLDFGL